jgi:hypothetical protein
MAHRVGPVGGPPVIELCHHDADAETYTLLSLPERSAAAGAVTATRPERPADGRFTVGGLRQPPDHNPRPPRKYPRHGG